ncbi:MAG: serine/threonine protein kinase [Deltaproteobacteria bacterium]|nr:serine/threonine protein kinase [Deltaproteobacteria bacterium]
MRDWLRHSHCSQLAAALLIPFLFLAGPVLLNGVLDLAYPEVETERKVLFGLIKRDVSEENPKREIRGKQLAAASWLISLSGLAFLFWCELPVALSRAAAAGSSSRRPASARVSGEGPLESSSPERGSIADRYRFQHRLGSGAMGVVHLAEDLALGRKVALKELHTDDTFAENDGDEDWARIWERFREEARALAGLSHPNVVQIFDIIEASGRIWIVMEYVDGGNLAELLKREGPMLPERALALIEPIATALAHLHASDIVHRDVKPLNILIAGDGTPKLADFGLAKGARSAVRTQCDVMLGSPVYMSPEQASGEAATAASDVYALGIVLYELLTGAPPFAGETASTLVAHLMAEAEPPSRRAPGIPSALDTLTLDMLEKDPADRFADAGAVVKRCREIREELG